MFCCPYCFSDESIRKIIETHAVKVGKCDICLVKDVPLIEATELTTHFQPLFDLFSNHPTCERSLNISTPVFLYQHLYLFWPKLFDMKRLVDADVHKLVKEISKTSDSDNKLFAESVELTTLIGLGDDGSLELKWDYFANEIKTKNRYFLNEMIDTDLLGSIFEGLASTYLPGTEFFRARLSNNLLLPADLGKPPGNLTKAGRANPVGIPYLYLSSDLKTTLYETRISLHETVSVGKFKLKEALNLVSLKNIKDIGPFEIQERGFELNDFISYRPYLKKLEDELSKPVRKQDVDLDYLPTQFLCEFIKSLGFDAVEYKSAMNPSGYNLALFNDSKVECVESKLYKVNSLTYDWNEL